MGYRSALGAGFSPGQIPTGPVEVNPNHPLAQGLGGLILGDGTYREIVSGQAGTPSGTSIQNSARGPVANFPNAGSISFQDSAALSPVQGITIAAWVRPVDYGNYNGIAGKTAANGVPNPYDLYLAQGSGLTTLYTGIGVSSFGFSGFRASTAPSAGAWQHIIAQVSSDALTGTFYLNGQPNGSGFSVDGTNPNVSNAGLPLLIGTRAGGATQMNGQIQAVTIYNRVIPPGEAAWLYAESFAMLQPVVQRKYYRVAAAAPTVTSDMWTPYLAPPYRARTEMVPY